MNLNSRKFLEMNIQVVRGKIEEQKVNAIVNPTDENLSFIVGENSQIYYKAGQRFKEECKKSGQFKPGTVYLTKGYDLPSSFVIHLIGPDKNNTNRLGIFKQAVKECFEIADKHGIETIAFPELGRSLYELPIQTTAQIFVEQVKKKQKTNSKIKEVFFVCSTELAYNIFKVLLDIPDNILDSFVQSIKLVDNRRNVLKNKLAKAIQKLEDYSKKLEQANNEIRNQKEEIEVHRDEIEEQRDEILMKNKDITDSINYALRIQNAILPPSQIFKENLTQSFILFKPKDIVSGDFYWMENIADNILFAACDCTGHGVPGALVSMVCHNALNQAIREYHLSQPAAILNKVDNLFQDNFALSENKVRDGMDISLCSYNAKTKSLEWAGARNPLWLVRNGNLLERKGDKQSIGDSLKMRPFFNHHIDIQKDDIIYIFSDGYQDQFGANGGKKITKKRFAELILSIQNLPMQEQRKKLDKYIFNHKGDEPQTDDIIVMGVKF